MYFHNHFLERKRKTRGMMNIAITIAPLPSILHPSHHTPLPLAALLISLLILPTPPSPAYPATPDPPLHFPPLTSHALHCSALLSTFSALILSSTSDPLPRYCSLCLVPILFQTLNAFPSASIRARDDFQKCKCSSQCLLPP